MNLENTKSMRPVTVAFMGLDGTGKSTQAEMLEHTIRQRGQPTVRVHHASTKVPVLKGLKRRHHSRMVALLKRRGSLVRWDDRGDEPSGTSGWFGQLLSGYLLVGSSLKSLWYRGRYRHHMVILDRCLLDDIVKARWRFGGGPSRGGWLIRRTSPPDLIVFFECDPSVSYQRKKEKNCTYAEYRGKQEVLESVIRDAGQAGWLIRRVPIDRKGPDEVHEEVLQVMGDGLETDGRRRPRDEFMPLPPET